MKRIACGVLVAASLAAGSAHAEITQADATALHDKLAAWFATWSFGLLDAATTRLTAVPEGDHLLLQFPFGGTPPGSKPSITAGTAAVRLQPLDGGRWNIQSASLPPSVTVAWPGEGKAKGGSTTLTLGKLTMAGVFDPTLATESKIDGGLDDYGIKIVQPQGTQTTHITKITSHALWTPVSAGRVSMTSDTAMDGYSVTSTGEAAMRMNVRRIAGRALLDDVDFASLGDGLRILSIAKDNDRAQSGPAKPMTAEQRKTAHAAINALTGVLGGMDVQQTWEGIQFTVADQSGTVKKASSGFSASAPGGKLLLKLPMALEGFDSPAITDEAMRDLMPHAIAFTPRLSGLSRQALLDALHRAVDAQPEKPDFDTEMETVLAAGKAVVGIDNIALDIGPMQLKGGGEIAIAGMADFTGAAELRATGLDALIRRVNATPSLKQAAPVLIFLKGIGEQEGADLVWKITAQDGAIEVNGTSLSDLGFPGK